MALDNTVLVLSGVTGSNEANRTRTALIEANVNQIVGQVGGSAPEGAIGSCQKSGRALLEKHQASRASLLRVKKPLRLR